jgi:HlyD family secretion protein
MSDSSSFQKLNKQPAISWALGLLTLFLAIGGIVLAYRQFGQMPQRASSRPLPVAVEQTDLTIIVSANGTVEPEKVVNVSPKTAGILKELLVDEGYTLKKGQIIAKMDDSDWQGQLLESQGKLAAAQANLRKLIAGNRPQEIAQAQAKLEEIEANLQKLMAGNRYQEIAQEKARLEGLKAIFKKSDDEYRRNQLLFNEGAISQQTLNEKLATKDSAQAAVIESQEKLSLLKEGTRSEEIAQAKAEVRNQQQVLDLLQAGTRQEEIDQARAEVTTAQGSLQNVKTQIEDTIIKAPFDGVVTFVYAEPGAFVAPTTTGSSVSSATSSSILSLVSQNEVVSNVAEKNIDKIRVGQKVTITADAYPDKVFHGRVSLIATQATVEQNVTSFEVKVTLEEKAARELKAGMNVSTDFQVGQLKNALTVPTIAVTRQNEQTGVFVGAPNQPPRFVPITTGVTIGNRTEVKSGLDGSEHILINPPSDTRPPQGFSWPSLFGGRGNEPAAGGLPPGAPPQGAAPPPGGPL